MDSQKNKFRDKQPARTYTGMHKNYRNYKDPLQNDFNHRCGYTDCPDCWFGGRVNFHIDHFFPWKKHPNPEQAKIDYSNLVYCCSYVNILKSDDTGEYLDPCNVDFNDHFYRDEFGNIWPFDHSDAAKHMHKKMQLYLSRYGIIWTLDKLEAKISLLTEAICKLPDGESKNKAKLVVYELASLFFSYRKYLSSAM